MLLPDKHISFAESLLGLGSYILSNINRPMTVDILWSDFEKVRGTDYPAYHSFDNFVIATDCLFAVGLININQSGELFKVKFFDDTLCA